MIDYSPFWKTLEISEESWYTLTKKHHISDSTLHRLKHNQDISMRTINDLCRILGCQIEDIAVYVPSDKDQKLYSKNFKEKQLRQISDKFAGVFFTLSYLLKSCKLI